jgi:hypothetical protein
VHQECTKTANGSRVWITTSESGFEHSFPLRALRHTFKLQLLCFTVDLPSFCRSPNETTEAAEATEPFLGEESLIHRLGFGGVALQNICVFALGTRRLKTGGSQDWLSPFFDPVSNHSPGSKREPPFHRFHIERSQSLRLELGR